MCQQDCFYFTLFLYKLIDSVIYKINLVMIDVLSLQVSFTKWINLFHLLFTKSICCLRIKQFFAVSVLNYKGGGKK